MLDTVVNVRTGRRTLVAALLAVLLVPVGAARADTTADIIRDCADGQIDGSYSRADLKTARNNIPSDGDEYTNCRGTIEAALLDAGSTGSPGTGSTGGATGSGGGTTGGTGGTSGAGGTGGGSSSQPSDPQNPTEVTALNEAVKGGGSPVRLGETSAIRPGETGLTSGDRRSVPNPLLVALILLGTAGLLGAVLAARARVVTRRLR